jgi:ABC-2 type transport system ATP-binding protein
VGIIREGQLARVGKVHELVAEKVNRVTLTLGVPVDETLVSAFAALPNVSQVTATDHTLEMVVQGNLDSVVKKAAGYPVLSLTSHEPSLEEAFLAYYS